MMSIFIIETTAIFVAQINQSKFSNYILVILIIVITSFVFANSIETNMLNPSIAYGKNKVFSKSISYTTAAGNNLEQPSSLVTQQSAYDINQASFKNIAFPSTIQSTNLTAIFKKVENSVVQITAKTPNPNLQIIINGVPLSNKSTRLGSGLVYDKQGHIITNTHVVDGASTADITFVDGNSYRAKLIGKDTSGDIAVLQITDDFSPENLIPIPIVNSSSLQVGQQVIAIGNPFGLSDTMTTGIISQTGRLLPNPDTRFSTPGTIQTDAAINPGNSGGPLLNILGQIIGINTAINSATGEFSGIGFAVPSNMIIKEVPTIIKTGTYKHPWIGITGSTITPDMAQSASLPRNFKGVAVASIEGRSPAERAGVHGLNQNNSSNTQKVGDIITGIDGRHLRSIDDLISYIDLHKSIGDKVLLTVNRHGQIMNLNLVLQARPPSVRNATSLESILP